MKKTNWLYFRRRQYAGFSLGIAYAPTARLMCIHLLFWTLDIHFQR
jgi:hypothetical protein